MVRQQIGLPTWLLPLRGPVGILSLTHRPSPPSQQAHLLCVRQLQLEDTEMDNILAVGWRSSGTGQEHNVIVSVEEGSQPAPQGEQRAAGGEGLVCPKAWGYVKGPHESGRVGGRKGRQTDGGHTHLCASWGVGILSRATGSHKGLSRRVWVTPSGLH